MNVDRSHFCLARVTLEARSAHGIHSGQGDVTHDVLLVRDANGLPALPGSSLAGVIRSAYRQCIGAEDADLLFGYRNRGDEDGQASFLTVGWGHVHDSQNHPVEGLSPDAASDPLLSFLLNDKPLLRQRVRLTHTGTAEETGKFDVTLIPAGVRYTTLISYWCDGSEPSRQRWQNLLALLGSPVLRIGHGTRSGNGHFEVVELLQNRWDLRTQIGRQGFTDRPRSRTNREGLAPAEPAALPKLDVSGTSVPPVGLQVRLDLAAEAGWRVGGGERSISGARHDKDDKHDKNQKEPDLLPQHEICVHWQDDRAEFGETRQSQHLLPGSAVKGALRHRVAYHYRCLTGAFAGTDSVLPHPEACPAVQQLFGHAEGKDGIAGVLGFHDILLKDTATALLMHNRIDRFTAGVINGALFSEEVLWQTRLELRISILPGAERVEATTWRAFERSLDDLANGWLPLGASGSRGLGVFSCVDEKGLQWSDEGQWISARLNAAVKEAI